MRRLNSRLFIFLGILLTAFSYVAWRIATGLESLIFLSLVFAIIFSFPFVHFQYEAHPWPRSKLFIQRLIYVSLGFMSYLFVLTIMRDIFLGLIIFIESPERREFLALATKGMPVFAFAAFLTFLGSLNAFYGMRVRKVLIPIEGLAAELQGFKIVQISDLHVGPTIRRPYVEKVISRVEKLKPDLIALTGDIGDGNVDDLKHEIAPLVRLKDISPVFYVPGNHEYYWDITAWLEKFKALGMSVLVNRGEIFLYRGKKLWVGGVSDPAAEMMSKDAAPNAVSAARGSEAAIFKLFLSHRPGLAQAAAQAGFDLQLSGHTHGGQFFPWMYVAKFFHEYFIGLARHEKMWVYVSPGTGWWGPPVRLGTTPEITLLELISK